MALALALVAALGLGRSIARRATPGDVARGRDGVDDAADALVLALGVSEFARESDEAGDDGARRARTDATWDPRHRAWVPDAPPSSTGEEDGDATKRAEDAKPNRHCAAATARASAAAQCRFCFEESGDLVSPCACSGTAAYVHVGCVRRWQRVSLQTHGCEEYACRVCGETFSLPKAPLPQRIAQWFSPRADDRVSQYGKVWLQMMINTALPGADTEALARPGQVARLLSAAEARIWAKREIRKGNALLRSLSRLLIACEWTHGTLVLLYAATGMGGIGLDIVSHAAIAMTTEQAPGASLIPLRAMSHALIGVCNGPLESLVRVTQPLHRLVHFFTFYPSFSLAYGAPENRERRRGHRPLVHFDFSVGAHVPLG